MEDLELEGKGLIIHHWDTDGVCSAALLLNRSENLDNFTPEIGNYFLTNEEIKKCMDYDFIIIADIALPEESISRLSKNSKVLIFDHHLQNPLGFVRHFNPVAWGEESAKWPSTTWVIKDFFEEEIDILTILGIVGDNESRIKENKTFSKIISEFCRENGFSFEDLLKMVYLVDSSYKVRDKEEVERIPRILKVDGIHEIVSNKKWEDNLSLLEKEIQNLLENRELIKKMKDILLMEIETPYVIASTITRKLAWNTRKNVVVINRGFFDRKDQIYVRTKDLSLADLIKRAKVQGFNAGGKEDVMSVIVSKDKTNFLVDKILNFLSKGDDK